MNSVDLKQPRPATSDTSSWNFRKSGNAPEASIDIDEGSDGLTEYFKVAHTDMDDDDEDLVFFKELPEHEHISRKRSVSTEDSDDRPLRRRRRLGSETAPEKTPWTITQAYPSVRHP